MLLLSITHIITLCSSGTDVPLHWPIRQPVLPLNPVEMACKSFDEICEKLNADAAFSKAFKEVYPDGFNQANITDAIQEFERTLLTPNSRFDKYLKGIMQPDGCELAGYDLFKKYNCATCHVGENMGGQLVRIARHQA